MPRHKSGLVAQIKGSGPWGGGGEVRRRQPDRLPANRILRNPPAGSSDGLKQEVEPLLILIRDWSPALHTEVKESATQTRIRGEGIDYPPADWLRPRRDATCAGRRKAWATATGKLSLAAPSATHSGLGTRASQFLAIVDLLRPGLRSWAGAAFSGGARPTFVPSLPFRTVVLAGFDA